MKIDYYSRYLKYKQKYTNLKGGARNFYLYLTLVDNADPSQQWGGVNILIVGKGNTLEKLRTLSAYFNNDNSTWTLSSTSKLREETVGDHRVMCFSSNTLDTLSERLVQSGFNNVKGLSRTGHPWHISDAMHSLDQQKEYFSKNRYWHLTISTEEDGQYTWERVIKKKIGFDFDGVIHTDVDNNPWSRNPIDHHRSNNACFTSICNKIRECALLGYKIFIITARSAKSRDIIRANLRHCRIDDWMISNDNIKTIGSNNKADLAAHLKLEEFYDDSQKNIKDFIDKKHILPRSFRLFKTFPETNDFKLIFQK